MRKAFGSWLRSSVRIHSIVTVVQCQLSFANLGIVIPNRLFGEESRAPQTEIPRRWGARWAPRNDNG